MLPPMPAKPSHTPPPPPRQPIPVAAAVMLGLVLGIFGYILFFAVAFRRPITDPIVYLPTVVLAPVAGVLSWFAWPHWLTVAACVAMPTVVWSLLGAAFDDGPVAAAHLGVAATAAACAFAGAFVGRTVATRRG